MAAFTLQGQSTANNILAAERLLNAFVYVMAGTDPTGAPRALQCDLNGNLLAGIASAGTQRTPTISTVTTGGTVAAGARKLTFIFSTDFTGSILGAVYSGVNDTSQVIDAPSGDTLVAVVYTVSAGTLRIVKIQ